jgi:hypothetical protein
MTLDVRLALLSGAAADGGVVLVAEAAYHLHDLVPTARLLESQGIEVAIVCPLPTPSRLRWWRSSWWRHEELLARSATIGLPPPEPVDAKRTVESASLVLVRNDWGVSTRPLVERAERRGVPTIGWVEGVQDFTDVDTGRDRAAYRTVRHVFCLGEYDSARLGGVDTTIVGSAHLWECWHGDLTSADGPAVANVNFTYGVLLGARRPWVRDVLAARRATGTELVLSRHPADRGRLGTRAESGEPVEQLLARAPRLVTRFSTLAYEALARGVELVYHNPHGERVATFAEPDGAFTITRTRAELVAALRAPVAEPSDVRLRAETFLGHHLALDQPPPAQRAAEAIVAHRR